MTDRPIIFSGPMVRALLDGRKTQTRRVLRDQPGPSYRYAMHDGFLGWSAYVGDPVTQSRFGLHVPYAPGDRLYVREAHAFGPLDPPPVIYRATAKDDGWEVGPSARWRPSIHMPRWASRLTLTVTEVRVQRLQEISEADAKAEGIIHTASGHFDYHEHAEIRFTSAVAAFRDLWNSLHGPDAWDANPWVVAVSFTVERRNIDEGKP